MSRGPKRSNQGRGGLAIPLLKGSLIGAIAFVASLVLAVFGLFAYAKSYLRSEEFRDGLAGKVARVLKAEAELDPVRWEGSSAYTNRFAARGYEDASFSELGIAGLRAEMDLSAAQFRRGIFKVPEMVVSQVDLHLSSSQRLAGDYAAVHSPASPVADAAPASARKPSLLSRLIPREVEVDQIRISNLNLYGEEADAGGLRATGIQTVVIPVPGGHAYEIQARGGTIQRPGQARLDLDHVDLRWKDRTFYISEALLRTAGGAEVDLDGEVALGRDGGPGTLLVNAEVSGLKLEDIMAENRAQRMRGNIRVTAKMEGDPAALDQARQTGVITLDRGVIEAFPVMEMLARYTRSERFQRVALRDGASARFERRGTHTVISGIDVQSDGLAKLTGDLEIDGGQLSGLLRLGVIPGTISWIPGAEQQVFQNAADGYLWTDVNVSGSVDDPQHDLVAQLREAGVQTVMEKVSEGFEDPGKARETVNDVIGAGREFLRGVFGR